MITINVSGNSATAEGFHRITSGTVGEQVKFIFGPEWAGLIKWACFSNGFETLPTIPIHERESNIVTIPAETLTRPNSRPRVGVYGETADGTIVIPTVYTALTDGPLCPGARKTGLPPTPPTPDWTTGIEADVNRAVETAEDVQRRADDREFDGDSAYEIAVKNGFTGSEAEWLEHLRGNAIAAEKANKAAQDAATQAKNSETAAKGSAEDAKGSETAAAGSATAAATSEGNAKASENAAAQSKLDAENASKAASGAANSATASAADAGKAAETAGAAANKSLTEAGRAESEANRAQKIADGIGIDATLTASGKAADAEVTGEKLRDVGSKVTQLKFKDGEFILLDGRVNTEDASRAASDFMYCIPGSTVYWLGESKNQYVNSISFYDRDKLFISGKSNFGENDEIHSTAVPDKARFARISILRSQKDKAVYRCDKSEIFNLITELENEKPRTELFQKYSEVEVTNYALLYDDLIYGRDYRDGALHKDSNKNATPILKLRKDKPCYTGTLGWTEASFFDSEKNFLEMKKFQYGKGNELTPNLFPEGSEYVAFSYWIDSLPADKFYISTVDNTWSYLTYGRTLKTKGERPKINVFLTDSEEEIFLKFCDAWYTEDCDVCFEYGEYNFDTIFELMKTKYKWNTAYELPIGGGCRYYFNSSILKANYTGGDSNVKDNYSLLGSHRRSSSYELFDGTLISEDAVYVVHDEAQGAEIPYVRRYHNIVMEYKTISSTNYLRKCIGGGTGLHGVVEIDSCIFKSDMSPDVSYHGHTKPDESQFRLSVKNCYFNNELQLHNLAEKETGVVLYSGNSAKKTPQSGDRWTAYEAANEVRP